MERLTEMNRRKALRMTLPSWLDIFSLRHMAVFIFGVFLFLGCSLPINAQSSQRTKAIESAFYPEPGCPVEVTSIRSVLEVDPFEAPIASRVYITYKNISPKTIKAVKFRVRFSDGSGQNKGTFHAPDGSPMGVAPGSTRSKKWRKEGGLRPDIQKFKVRVLVVKYADGSIWESIRMKQLKQKMQESNSQN